ncbi:hypothetical protein D3C78_757870 [compost metagenome]
MNERHRTALSGGLRTVVADPHWQVVAGGGHRGHAGADRPTRRRTAQLRSRHPRAGAGTGPRGRARTDAWPVPQPAAWHSHRPQGPAVDGRRADCRRHADSWSVRSEGRRHRGRPLARGRRGDARQVADDRGCLRHPPPGLHAAEQPVERRSLDGRFVQRLRRGYRRRPVLRLVGERHRRFDPLPLCRQRAHRPQADLGPGQPLWRLRTGRQPRPYRPHHSQRARRLVHAVDHRRP